jgi:hypothetical protein
VPKSIPPFRHRLGGRPTPLTGTVRVAWKGAVSTAVRDPAGTRPGPPTGPGPAPTTKDGAGPRLSVERLFG